ncbi:D-glycerate 3-kinase, plant type [hydrothermal vent metagenome]|uniref:D-glycerate 3-kinase, plant type n=1 Tax=hydrothermal vent metagenome TaxID=652676 RepID=A0A3B0XLJ9_9ZZZZ
MFSELNHLLSDEERAAFSDVFSPELDAFIKSEKLNDDFKSSFISVYLPLAKWINNKHTEKSLIIGINGAQGSGKSTLSKLLLRVLKTVFNKSVLHLSIDDLYLSQKKRLHLSNTIHPLLKVRGVPGTHDVELGIKLLNEINKSKNKKIKLPIFDKSIDDLLPQDDWLSIENKIDIVLFEGWCVDAKAQSESELKKPINILEKKEDTDLCWRTYVNLQLSNQYKKLFSYIDYLIMLQVPNMNSVFEWRSLQENKLQQREAENSKTMSEEEIKKFIMYFERITRHCLSEMPDRADVLLTLNKAHQVASVHLL